MSRLRIRLGVAGLLATAAFGTAWAVTTAQDQPDERAILISELRLRQASTHSLEARILRRRKARVMAQLIETLRGRQPVEPSEWSAPASPGSTGGTSSPQTSLGSSIPWLLLNENVSLERLRTDVNRLETRQSQLEQSLAKGPALESELKELRRLGARLAFPGWRPLGDPLDWPEWPLERRLKEYLAAEPGTRAPRVFAPNWERLQDQGTVPEPEWTGVPMGWPTEPPERH